MYVDEIKMLKHHLNTLSAENEKLKSSQEASDTQHYNDALQGTVSSASEEKQLFLKTKQVEALQRKLRQGLKL